jgi:hypothetical protein
MATELIRLGPGLGWLGRPMEYRYSLVVGKSAYSILVQREYRGYDIPSRIETTIHGYTDAEGDHPFTRIPYEDETFAWVARQFAPNDDMRAAIGWIPANSDVTAPRG